MLRAERCHRLLAAWAGLSLALSACGSSGTHPATSSSHQMAGMSMSPGTAMSGGTGMTSARIDSVTTSGSPADPKVIVRGQGFGAQPAPDPASVPEGQQGCPAAPAAGDGHLYGTHLYFTDLHARVGSYTSWTAGEFTPGGNGQFDCVGLVIDRWTPTEVVFGFGNLYDKMIPQNYYLLSSGDTFQVWVQGATFRGTARLS